MRLRFALLLLTVTLSGCIQTYREREKKAGEDQEPVLVPNTPSYKELRHISAF